MNLLVFNLRTDVSHSTLGFTTSWINALARRFDHVVVVSLYTGVLDVAPNVSVHRISSDPNESRAWKVLRFYKCVSSLIRNEKIHVCFAHMAPVFAVLFWPLAKVFRIPVLLWYAHGSLPLTLRLAHALVDRCVTSTPSGFRVHSAKLYVLGQGIDTVRFAPSTSGARASDYDVTILSVGRITARKRLEEIIDAVALLHERGHTSVSLLLIGGTLTPRDEEYRRALQDRTRARGLRGHVRFEGSIPFDQIPSVYKRGAIFVNLSETGSLDKAILEAMASGCIPVSRNQAFSEIARAEGLEGLVPGPGPARVADCVRGVLSLSAGERDALRQRARQVVVRDHGLDGLAQRIAEHLAELAGWRIADES